MPRVPLLSRVALRETLLGLGVLAAVLGGVSWARGRGRVERPPLAGLVVPANPAPGTATGDAGPDVSLADGSVDLGDVRIVLSVAPRPPAAFERLRFRARAEGGGAAVPLAEGRISFEMEMPMGDHRYRLLPGPDGWREAEVVLPACPSGRRRWYATVEATVGGRPRTARFRLDLAPAPGPTAP